MSQNLPRGLFWCRKAKYRVHIARGCYKIDAEHPLMPGFKKKEFLVDGKTEKYAVKYGFNFLEQQDWETNPEKEFLVTGTVGEQWTVSREQLSAYDVNPDDIGIYQKEVWTKDPFNQEFLVTYQIPEGREETVVPNSAYRADGTIDETMVMHANSPNAKVAHNGGDFVIAKHIEGCPEYAQIPFEQRTMQVAQTYHPRVVNGSVMSMTYDVAETQDKIIAKYR